MLPRSRRVGTIYISAAEVRDRSRPAHGAFYSTISLPGRVYTTRGGKGLTIRRVTLLYKRLDGDAPRPSTEAHALSAGPRTRRLRSTLPTR